MQMVLYKGREQAMSDQSPTRCYRCGAELSELERGVAGVSASPIGLCVRCSADQGYLAESGLERGRSGAVYERRPTQEREQA